AADCDVRLDGVGRRVDPDDLAAAEDGDPDVARSRGETSLFEPGVDPGDNTVRRRIDPRDVGAVERADPHGTGAEGGRIRRIPQCDSRTNAIALQVDPLQPLRPVVRGP